MVNLRRNLNRPLTWEEMDDNFSSLNEQTSLNRDNINSVQTEVYALADSSSRYAFDSLQEAQDKWASFSQEEKNELDGKEFTISTGTDAGVYVWDSSTIGGAKFSRGLPSLPVESISQLRNYKGRPGEAVDVLGYYESGDGGGGTFYWDAASTEPDNGGTVIESNGVVNGRWNRRFEMIKPKMFGIKGKGLQNDLSKVQKFFTYCCDNGENAVFENDIFQIGDVELTQGIEIRTVGATIINAQNMSSQAVFSATLVHNLKLHVKYEVNDLSKRLLFINNGADLSTKIKNLDINCEINDISDTEGGSRSSIYLVCSLDSPKISVIGRSINGNNAALVHNAHGSANNNDIDLSRIEVFGWGSGWIHDGTGYSEGENFLRYFYAENAKGRVSGDGNIAIISTYHMRNLKVGDVYSINCDCYAYLWTPYEFKLLYNKGYTGLNQDDDKKCAILVETAFGGGGNIVSLDSEYDGVRYQWGGNVDTTSLRAENCKGYPLIAKYDLQGGAFLDVSIGSILSTNNHKGTILIENSGTTENGIRKVSLKGGILRDNDKSSTNSDIKIITRSGPEISISGISSTGSNCAIEVTNLSSTINLLSITDCPSLRSTGDQTIKIIRESGGLMYGRKIIKNNAIDNTGKISVSTAGYTVVEQNFDISLGEFVPELLKANGVGGTFTDPNGKTVTVENGIITSITEPTPE